MRKLIKSYTQLHVKIQEIIDYNSALPNIVPMLETKYWVSPNGKYINFDRYGDGDMEEYGDFTISSLGMEGKKLYHGESDGLYFVMAYDSDAMWDDTEIFIFDLKNKVE